MAGCCLSAGWSAAPVNAESNIYDQHQNIVYREAHGVGLLADVFTPKGESKCNGIGIVQVVSGAWSADRGKIRDLKRARIFDIFCGRGYTVFAIRPGSISKFSAIEMAKNLEAGILWVKEHATDYRIDPARLGMIGASAGGHLASLVAVTNGSMPNDSKPTVQAAGVFFPPTDFLNYRGRKVDPRNPNGFGRIVKRLALPDGTDNLEEDEIWKRVKSISPAHLVTKDAPPFLLIHGDADPLVPLQQSESLLKSLQANDIPAKLIIKKGGEHPWLTIPEEVKIMADWFDVQLKAEDSK